MSNGNKGIKKDPLSWRRPTFAQSAIIGAGELNCRVRNGNGCGLSAHATKTMGLFLATFKAQLSVSVMRLTD